MNIHLQRLAFNVAIIGAIAIVLLMTGCGTPISQAQCETISGEARPTHCK